MLYYSSVACGKKNENTTTNAKKAKVFSCNFSIVEEVNESQKYFYATAVVTADTTYLFYV